MLALLQRKKQIQIIVRMRNIFIIIAIILLYSCAPGKKVTQSESHSELNIQSNQVDTTKKVFGWEIVLNNVIKEIDLTKIKITSYYPIKDSSGKQLIKDEILIDNNKTVVSSSSGKELKTEQENKGLSSEIAIKDREDSKVEIIEKRGVSKFALYLIIAGLLIIAVMVLYLKFKPSIISFVKKLLFYKL